MSTDGDSGRLMKQMEMDPPPKPRWTKKRKLILGGVAIATVIIIALAVGLGVGLTRRNDDNDDDSDSSDGGIQTSGSPLPVVENSTIGPGGVWQPSVGVSWNYELYGTINTTNPNGIYAWGIDLFDNPITTMAGLQANGARVICYFSAGSYEDWRADQAAFQAADLGDNLDGWPGERWLNISSPSVRSIMLTRLDLAVTKGCDGVDPDNMDGYDNTNGFNLTQADAINYAQFLAAAAQERKLAIGLKNAGAIIPSVINLMQWSVNEECERYSECDTYAPFIKAGKPVFHVEYPKGTQTNNNKNVSKKTKKKICGDASATGFSTIIKNILLDHYIQTCP